MNRRNAVNLASVAVLIALVSMTAACRAPDAVRAAPAPPVPAVSVVEVTPQDVPIFSEYAAQTYARDLVEIRGRVDGWVEKRLFQVGSEVKAGQPLYILDLRPYQAEVAKARAELAQSEANLDFARRQVALQQAEADLAVAEANLFKTEQDVARLEPLVKEDAASRQDLDNALAALKANRASLAAKRANVEQNRLSTRTQIDAAQGRVEANRALLRNAELNLEYATIRAPISGVIGDSLIQVGGLVSRSAPQPLTTVVPTDPIWVRFKVSEQEIAAYRRLASSSSQPLQLILAGNAVHPYPGRLENTVNQVDPKTGTLELQATFPNPQRAVMPGQFGRLRVQSSQKHGVILVPQKAIEELQGLQSVLTVGPDNKVLARSVVTGDRVDERWIVEQGLRPGDRVIVEGLQKARPGTAVRPEPYRAPARQQPTGGN
jgi:membrane fusion protein (multidrug efflux system)